MKGKQDVWNKWARSEGFMGQGKCCSEVEWLVWRYNVKRKRGKHFDDGNECLLLWHRIAWWVVEETTGLWPRLDKTGCLRTNLLVIWGSSEKTVILNQTEIKKKTSKQNPPEDKHTQTSWELSTEPPQAFTTRAESTTAEEQAGFYAVADWSWCGPGELMTEAEQVGSDQDTDESLRARPRDKCQHCHRCLNVCVNGW